MREPFRKPQGSSQSDCHRVIWFSSPGTLNPRVLNSIAQVCFSLDRWQEDAVGHGKESRSIVCPHRFGNIVCPSLEAKFVQKCGLDVNDVQKYDHGRDR